MGTGYIAPAVQPKIGWDTQSPPIPFPASGLLLSPGAGIFPSTDRTNKKLGLNAARSEPPEVLDLFVPGLVAAKTIGVWHNRRASNVAQLLAMEANFITAPTAGSAANGWAVRLTDAAGVTATLPISGAAAHFFTDWGDAQAIAAPYPDTNLNTTAVGAAYVAEKISSNTPLVVNGFSTRATMVNEAGSSPYPSIAGFPYRFSIWDSTFTNRLAMTTDVVALAGETTTGPISRKYFPLSQSFTMLANTDYWITFDGFGTGLANWTRLTQTATSAGRGADPLTLNKARATIDPGGPGATQPANLPADATWGNTFPVGGQYHAYLQASPSAALFANGGLTWIHGQGTTVTLSGDVTATLVSVGAPPAGSAGTDVNVRCVFGFGT